MAGYAHNPVSPARPAPAIPARYLRPLITFATAAALALAPNACTRRIEIEPPPEGVPTVRVLLLRGRDRAEVRIPGPYRIVLRTDSDETEELAAGDGLATTVVTYQRGDISVSGVIARAPGIVEFIPQDVPFRLDGSSYRGSLLIAPGSDGLRAINLVDMEGYLRGVVPGEMYTNWPEAALQAQAVAARTYALARMRARADRDYDLVSTTADQRYAGLDAEKGTTDAAVLATAALALYHRGWPFAAYYHSCCGGHTADPLSALGDPRSPIQPVPCTYCEDSREFEWTQRIPRQETLAKLGVEGATGIQIAQRSPDGRVTQVDVRRGDEPPVSMTGAAFRQRVGGMVVRSTLFRVRRDGDRYVFQGRGFGHGVGMCQWGARGMAEAGNDFRQILEAYYPGAELRSAYELEDGGDHSPTNADPGETAGG